MRVHRRLITSVRHHEHSSVRRSERSEESFGCLIKFNTTGFLASLNTTYVVATFLSFPHYVVIPDAAKIPMWHFGRSE